MNNILELFNQSKEIQDINKNINEKKGNILCTGATSNASVLLCASIHKRMNETCLYICENAYKANMAYDKLTKIVGINNVNLYVCDDFASTEAIVISNELKQERLSTLFSIFNKDKNIIVTHMTALTRPLLSLDRFTSAITKINKGDEIDSKKLINQLTKMGYKRASTTYMRGEYSVRGEVIDIFPSCYEGPIRINIGFDEVETIKPFDVKTQLTTKQTYDSLTIFPVNEMIVDINLDELKNKLINIEENEYLLDDFNDIISAGAYDKLYKYISYIDEKFSCLPEYLEKIDSEFITFFDSESKIKEAYENQLTETIDYLENRMMYKKIKITTYLDYYYVNSFFKNNVYLTDIKNKKEKVELIGLYPLNSYKVIAFDNDIKHVVEYLKQVNKKIYITFSSEKRLNVFEEILKLNNVQYDVLSTFYDNTNEKISLVVCENAIGFGFFDRFEVLTENEIYKKGKVAGGKFRSVTENTTIISTKEDLQVGDYVVHYDYGIGKYLGIKSVELNGLTNDYLKIQYGNMDLLVPVDRIKELEKYLGSEGVVPHLTKIGTNEWEKRKNAVRNELVSIAKELIDLQVKRSKLSGYKYCEDSELQLQFEEDFEFEETQDQITIVNEIKREMEKGVLIDRLVCGDVGFGKTEIALRIAFKTIYEGKQVAFMAPTTILSRQHYFTVKERFSKYGITVELLNRMVPEKKQMEVIKKLREGKVDIVIGTHRLLNSEITYKDLGLLIIDEEQRFGVTHKEKIKQIKNSVNVLTLTATPIPRTLQMAVSGIRELSLLETPPKDRYPIQTFVYEASDTIIKEAICRELARDGQVFFLHNKISDIELVARKIKKLVPEAKICIGHGKMERENLEDVISSFIDGEYNVLLCTTIIETGIDIPNSNTLIVDDATRLGLAQMYQIRGRVGRTDRVAYAYFMYNPGKKLSSNSEKRLSAIKEYSRIGSGYKIAVRDLAIRGAGDILGKEQSGFINSIGIDMYMKLLNEAVGEVQGIEVKKKANYQINISKHVERNYVDDDSIIIYIHKEINSIDSMESKKNTIESLQDRFGKLSETVLDYVEEKYLENLLRKMAVDKVKEEEMFVTINVPKDYSRLIKGDYLVMEAYKLSSRFSFNYRSESIEISLKKASKNDKKWIYLMTELLTKVNMNLKTI